MERDREHEEDLAFVRWWVEQSSRPGTPSKTLSPKFPAKEPSR